MLARRLLDVCTRPLTVTGVLVHPSASMGVARAGASHATAQDLLRDADIAMYEAKARGKNRFAVCDDEARVVARDTLQLLADLRQAIDTGEIQVAYQPVVDMATASPPALHRAAARGRGAGPLEPPGARRRAARRSSSPWPRTTSSSPG